MSDCDSTGESVDHPRTERGQAHHQQPITTVREFTAAMLDGARAIEGIDRHLPYLHKERWAIEHARLRDVVRSATGEEQERARRAVQDHYATRDHPKASREALIAAIGRAAGNT